MKPGIRPDPPASLRRPWRRPLSLVNGTTRPDRPAPRERKGIERADNRSMNTLNQLVPFLIHWGITALSLWVASHLFKGLKFDRVGSLIVSALLLGFANAIIKPGRVTLPSILQQAGFRSAVVGKWHLGLGEGSIDWNKPISPGPLEIGFDESFIIPATGGLWLLASLLWLSPLFCLPSVTPSTATSTRSP